MHCLGSGKPAALQEIARPMIAASVIVR